MKPVLTVAAGMVLLAACSGPPPPPATEVRAAVVDRLPDSPGDTAWSGAPVMDVQMLPQDLVEPRLLAPSVSRVQVQALHDGARLAFRLRWEDTGAEDHPGPARFPDACAVQLPRVAAADVPAPQMGEPGRPVDIVYWRASWQASADGRPDTIEALMPGAVVDHYPFAAPSLEEGSEIQRRFADRYAPARALGNVMEGPREQPVQDLVAEGPGTLRPAGSQSATGRGARTAAGWEVVLARPLPASLGPGGRTQVALAVWEGGRDEVGSRKMRSGWVPLVVEEAP